jgi:hypothetical protein
MPPSSHPSPKRGEKEQAAGQEERLNSSQARVVWDKAHHCQASPNSARKPAAASTSRLRPAICLISAMSRGSSGVLIALIDKRNHGSAFDRVPWSLLMWKSRATWRWRVRALRHAPSPLSKAGRRDRPHARTVTPSDFVATKSALRSVKVRKNERRHRRRSSSFYRCLFVRQVRPPSGLAAAPFSRSRSPAYPKRTFRFTEATWCFTLCAKA